MTRQSAARAVLALVVAGTALVVIDMTIVTIGLSEIQADLDGTMADIQWVIVAYTITMGAVTQVAGTLSDRLGRKRVYLAGLGLFTGASLACGLASDVLALDVARVFQGIGGAVLMSNALPILSDAYEGQRRNTAISAWGTMATAASLAAPLLGGVLVDLMGWRAIFLINVPLGVAALAAGVAVLPPSPAAREGSYGDGVAMRSGGSGDGAGRGSVDWLGAGLLIAALAIGNFALLRGEQQGWGAAATLVQLGASAALLVGFVLVERRAAAPTMDPGLFLKPAFAGAAFAVFMSRVLTVGGSVYLVQHFQHALQLSPTQSGLLLAPVFIAQMGAGLLGGRLLGRFAAGRVIAAGYACKVIGAAWLGLAFAASAQPLALVIPLLFWGTGGGIAGAPVMAVAMNVTDRARAGMVAGTVSGLASIGAGVGTAALGILYTARLGAGGGREAVASAASAVLFTSAALAAVTAAAALVLIGKRNAPAAQKEAAARLPSDSRDD
ncbi:MFS transporter [Nonomuraea roseola]|uniref:MFS transporter n=1 Tax=Nonomuraea roseola TaxID=46179 RepID=A0ABV5Q648_9ACTN